MHIVGLTDGGLYYVHLDDSLGLLSDQVFVRLATSYCKATGDGCAQDLLGISKSAVTNADGATHALRPAPINGLTDGVTYQVHRVNGTEITLRTVGGGSDIGLSMSHIAGDSHDSNQHLFLAGAPLTTSLACGTHACGQQVYVKLTGSLPSTRRRSCSTPTAARFAAPLRRPATARRRRPPAAAAAPRSPSTSRPPACT
jgi:hypothetical protein